MPSIPEVGRCYSSHHDGKEAEEHHVMVITSALSSYFSRLLLRSRSVAADRYVSSSASEQQHSLSNGKLRHKLRSGQPTLGVVTGFHNDTDHAETLGLLGYDFLWADAEHSTANASTIANLILAAERRGLPTLVRIGDG